MPGLSKVGHTMAGRTRESKTILGGGAAPTAPDVVAKARSDDRILVAVTGASGAVYAERLVDILRVAVSRLYLLLSETATQVVRHELAGTSGGEDSQSFNMLKAAQGKIAPADRDIIRLLNNGDLFAPVASGSSAPTAMVILPCSMGCLARIAHGVSSTLIERAADVCLKQKVPLIVCPRETPLNTIHLRNMLTLAEAGAHIVPAMPAFYHKPRSVDDLVDFQVGRVLEALKLPHTLYPQWNSRLI